MVGGDMAREVYQLKRGPGFAVSLLVSLCACTGVDKKPDEIAGMTAAEVEAYIKGLGGRRVKIGDPPIKLERGFDVNPGLGGITVTNVLRDGCDEYCWTQVVRKSLDGKVI